MTTIVWIIVVLVCLAGGIWLGRYTAPGVERARAMEQERDEAHAELQRYREDVRTHFETTAHLFNQVTGSYRQLYEHLAEGSERLGTGPSAGMLESRPEDRTLQGPEQATGEATSEERNTGVPAARASSESQKSEHAGGGQPDDEHAPGAEPESGQPPEEQPRGPATEYAQERDPGAEEKEQDESDEKDEARRA